MENLRGFVGDEFCGSCTRDGKLKDPKESHQQDLNRKLIILESPNSTKRWAPLQNKQKKSGVDPSLYKKEKNTL